MFLPRFFRKTSSERRCGHVHLVEGPEEAPGTAGGITWPTPLACFQHNPTAYKEQENGWMDIEYMRSFNMDGMECCVSFSVESLEGRAHAEALNGN